MEVLLHVLEIIDCYCIDNCWTSIVQSLLTLKSISTSSASSVSVSISTDSVDENEKICRVAVEQNRFIEASLVTPEGRPLTIEIVYDTLPCAPCLSTIGVYLWEGKVFALSTLVLTKWFPLIDDTSWSSFCAACYTRSQFGRLAIHIRNLKIKKKTFNLDHLAQDQIYLRKVSTNNITSSKTAHKLFYLHRHVFWRYHSKAFPQCAYPI